VAGKTGTTDEFQNAWFVGYTPTLATAVWMGSPTGYDSMRRVGGITVYGGTYPARIWHEYMAAALGDGPAVGFPEPEPSFSSRYLSIDSEYKVPTRRTPATIAPVGPDVAAAEPAPAPVDRTPSVEVPPVSLPGFPVITVPRRNRSRPVP